MRQRRIRSQTGIVAHPNYINPVRKYLFLYIFQVMSERNSLKLHTQSCCKGTTFRQQLKAHVGNYPLFYLAIYKYTVHIILDFRF